MVVLVNGRVEKRNDDLQLIVNRIQDAAPLLEALPKAQLFIRLDADNVDARTDLLKNCKLPMDQFQLSLSTRPARRVFC